MNKCFQKFCFVLGQDSNSDISLYPSLQSIDIAHAQFYTKIVNSFLAVHNLKMALKEANILNHIDLKVFRLTLLRAQNVRIRVRKNTMRNIYPVVDRNGPIRKTQAQDQYRVPKDKITTGVQERKRTPSV